MKPPAQKVAANDPRLAHALMRHAVEQEGDALLKRIRAMFPTVEQQSVPRLSKAIQRAFGPLLVSESVYRLHGTRAQASWMALIAAEDGDVIPMYLHFQKQFLDVKFMRFRFTQHAISRVAQRSIGAADLQQVGPILCRHLQIVLTFLKLHREEGRHYIRFNTTSKEGMLLWRWRGEHKPEGEWTAMTWVNAQNAADPTLARDCEQAGDTHGLLRVIESISR